MDSQANLPHRGLFAGLENFNEDVTAWQTAQVIDMSPSRMFLGRNKRAAINGYGSDLGFSIDMSPSRRFLGFRAFSGAVRATIKGYGSGLGFE